MDLSKYSKEEIYSKLVEALKEGANHLENVNRFIKENNELQKQLSLQNVSEILIAKYMRHVRECEGVDFVEDINSYKSDVIFTDEEEQALIEYSSR